MVIPEEFEQGETEVALFSLSKFPVSSREHASWKCEIAGSVPHIVKYQHR